MTSVQFVIFNCFSTAFDINWYCDNDPCSGGSVTGSTDNIFSSGVITTNNSGTLYIYASNNGTQYIWPSVPLSNFPSNTPVSIYVTNSNGSICDLMSITFGSIILRLQSSSDEQSCSSTSDCPTDQVYSCMNSKCVLVNPKTSCSSDSDCSGDLICLNGCCAAEEGPGSSNGSGNDSGISTTERNILIISGVLVIIGFLILMFVVILMLTRKKKDE